MRDASGGGGGMPPTDGSATRHPLAPIFEPRSIAVVGASADPAKRGYQILRALGEGGFRGEIYPVNPKGGSLMGHQVFPSVRSLPEPPDLAVLCTPAERAPALVRECGEAGIGGAVVLAVGFGESGTEGNALQAALVDAARETGIRVVGPNTSGLLNLRAGANLIGARGVRPGRIALLVQSGNMALTLMTEATETTWDGISICAGLGNEADLTFGEALDYLGAHPDTEAVIVYVEGFADVRGFLDVASRVTRDKPVVVIKSGRSERGAASALSHTGALAGPYELLKAGLAQAGAVEVRRTDELLAVAHALATQPIPSPERGTVILSDGGGQGTLAIDMLSDAGVPLAALSDDTRTALRALLGPAAAVGNPVDLAGAADSDPRAFAHTLDLIVRDDAVGSVLVVGLFGGYAIRFSETLGDAELGAAHTMTRTADRAEVALVVHSMYARHRSPPLEVLGRAGVPVLGSLDTACRCIAEIHAHRARLDRPAWSPLAAAAVGGRGRADSTSAPATERRTDPTARTARTALTEPDARTLLGEHGVTFGESAVARTPDEAAAAVARLGRCALKIVSEGIVHKRDAGGVALDVVDEAGARDAFERVTDAAARWLAEHDSPAEPPAVLVVPMAEPPIVELLVGATRDPSLGPVLTVGAGGSWVELFRDVAHRLLPVAEADVRAMLDELSIAALLTGVRGEPPADVDAVVRCALGIARCVAERPDVLEVEINPLFVYSDRAAPVDARVIVEAGRG